MRIVVNDIAASNGGALSILKDFYSYVKFDTQNEWIFLLGDNYLEETDNIKIVTFPDVKRNKLKKVMFDLFNGAKYINQLNADVVLSLQNIITFGVKSRQIVYIHQVLPFQTVKNFSFFKRAERVFAIYQKIIGKFIVLSAKKADKVIVQTEYMKKLLMSKTKIKADKIVCIMPNVEILDNYANGKTFDNHMFFYPTSKAVYKNNECIYNACKILRDRGIDNFEVKLTIEDDAHVDNIKYVGRIPRDEVLVEYSKSTLLFPSYIESFGLPMAEARNIGTVILASDCGFSREVLSRYDNSYFFDYSNPRELADLMEKVIKGIIVKKDIKAIPRMENSWSILMKVLQEK